MVAKLLLFFFCLFYLLSFLTLVRWQWTIFLKCCSEKHAVRRNHPFEERREGALVSGSPSFWTVEDTEKTNSETDTSERTKLESK